MRAARVKRRAFASRPAQLAAAALVVIAAVACGPARGAQGEGEAGGGGAGGGRPPADVPLGHWAYRALDRLASRGFIEIGLTTLPVSRAEVRRALRARARGPDAPPESRMTEREAWSLSRLEAEFLRGEVDRPFFEARDERAAAGLGIRLAARAEYEPDVPDEGGASARVAGSLGTEFRPAVDVEYELWGGVPDLLGFYSDARVVLSGQRGERQVRLSSRARTWRGVSAVVERAYVKLERPAFSLLAGRTGEAWGRSRRSGLLLSGTAATFDELGASFAAGPVSFRAVHALLEYETLGTEPDLKDGERVFLAGHRAVFTFGAGSVGVSETVVYSSVNPDPVYLNPLAPFYLSQHNERSNDNVLWSLDLLVRPVGGLDVYGELLVDDLMYERNVEHPDKYGFCVGQTYHGALGGDDYEISLEYAHVRKWTYTHGTVEHRFVHDGRPIGFELGPDADRIILSLDYHPTFEWSLGASLSFSRKGEGDITEPYEDGTSFEPEFPSGVVERTTRVSLSASYDDLSGLWGELGLSFSRIGNEGNVIGSDDDRWELRGGIGFRI